MNKLFIIFIIFLTGCSSTLKGTLHTSTTIDFINNKASCPKDRHVIYEQIDTITSLDQGTQTQQFSWQCTKNNNVEDTYRVYIYL